MYVCVYVCTGIGLELPYLNRMIFAVRVNGASCLSPPFLSGCLSIQSFIEEPSYTEVNPGGNAELRCLVENIGGECRWQKDGKVRPLWN
jgi:hypothetical protein